MFKLWIWHGIASFDGTYEIYTSIDPRYRKYFWVVIWEKRAQCAPKFHRHTVSGPVTAPKFLKCTQPLDSSTLHLHHAPTPASQLHSAHTNLTTAPKKRIKKEHFATVCCCNWTPPPQCTQHSDSSTRGFVQRHQNASSKAHTPIQQQHAEAEAVPCSSSLQ